MRGTLLKHLIILAALISPLPVGLGLCSHRLFYSEPQRLTIKQYIDQGAERSWVEISEVSVNDKFSYAVYDAKSSVIDAVYTPLRPADQPDGVVHLLLKDDRSRSGFFIADGLFQAWVNESSADEANRPAVAVETGSVQGALTRLKSDDRQLLKNGSGWVLAPDCRVLDQADEHYLTGRIMLGGGVLWFVSLFGIVYVRPAVQRLRKRAWPPAPAAPPAVAPPGLASQRAQYRPLFYLALVAWLASLPFAVACIYVYGANLAPVRMPYSEYDPADHRSEYLHFDQAYLNLTEAVCVVMPRSTIDAADGEAFYVPLRERNRDEAPIRAFLKLTDPGPLALARRLAATVDEPQAALELEAAHGGEFHWTGSVKGVRDWNPLSEGQTRTVLSNAYAGHVHPDFILLAQDDEPSLGMALLFGFLCAALGIASVVTHRKGWPPADDWSLRAPLPPKAPLTQRLPQ